MLRSLRFLVLAATLAAGCSNNSSVHGIFGPAGGTLSDDSATLTIPPGALASETTITMTPAPGIAAPDGTLQVGTPQILAPEGEIFVSPVTLQMKLDPAKLDGHPTSAIAVYTAPVGSTTYVTLPTAIVDATHVSARTIHFSIFQPDVPINPSATAGGSTGATGGTTGGTSGRTTTGTGGEGTGTTGKGTAGRSSSGNTAAGGSSTAGSSTGTASGGTSSGTTGGEPPDAGEDDAGPGIPDSGGTAICSANTDCIGAGGCLAIAIDSLSSGTASCNNPFLGPTSATGAFANGGSIDPSTLPATPSLDLLVDNWVVQLELPCCPASTGTMAVSAVASWSGGPVNCDGAVRGKGTLDFTALDSDGGLAGTFTTTLLNGMTGSFSLPATLDATFCDAGQPVLPPAPVDIEDAGVDAGTADCSPDLDCLGPDAGGLSGTGSFWLNPSAAADGTWCKGPLEDLASTVSIAGVAAPTITVTYAGDFFELLATLPCCPAGPGTLEATSIDLSSNVCGATPNQLSPVVSGGTGTVTFTQTDGGLVGSIHLDGTTEADATFSL